MRDRVGVMLFWTLLLAGLFQRRESIDLGKEFDRSRHSLPGPVCPVR